MNELKLFISNNFSKIIFVSAIILSMCASIYYYKTGYITAYGDSRAHLNISRRVVDNLTPGAAQLGGVWLPLLHILMLPFISSNFLWHSGLAGTIVSSPMYVLAVIFVCKTLLLVTDNKVSALIGSLIMMLNINFLYLQTTPMTEALFVASLTGSVYFLTKWSYTFKVPDLIAASAFFFLSTINRYEGWPTAVSGALLIGIIAFRFFGIKYAEGKVILFNTVAFLGIGLWLLWQFLIFGNPLYFLKSEYSAKSQTMIAIKLGEVPQYHDVSLSIMSFLYSLIEVIGPTVVFISILGLILYCLNIIRNIGDKKTFNNMPLLVLLVPGIFLMYALYNGNIPLSLPQIIVNGKPGTYFNIRYALYSLPAISIYYAMISKKILLQIPLMFLVIFGSFMLVRHGPLNTATINDTKNNIYIGSEEMLVWINDNTGNDLILTSAATTDPIIFGTGKNNRNFITEGNSEYWKQSLDNPSKYANWMIITDDDRDMLKKHLLTNKIDQHFVLAEKFGIYSIYKKND